MSGMGPTLNRLVASASVPRCTKRKDWQQQPHGSGQSGQIVSNPEAEALAALERGDRDAAITVLMSAYGDEIYRRCCMICGDGAMADDVRQVVFIEAHRDLQRFEKRSKFRTWLFSIARHRCLDALKKRRPAPLPEGHETVDPARSADEALTGASDAAQLEHCLKKLNLNERLAVLLRYQEEMSFTEIGRICHEQPGTLAARVARTMPKLFRCLKARGVER